MNRLCPKLVSALRKRASVDQAKKVHARIVVLGLDQYSVVLAKLVRTLTELGVPMEAYARVVFDRVDNPNPFLWTALIRGYALQGRVSESVGLYSSMRMASLRPLSFTFSAIFKACGGSGDAGSGRAFHAQTILLGGFEFDLYVSNTLIDMYAKCGSLECAHKIFDEMPERDIISWTQLIVAYARIGHVDTAAELFGRAPAKDGVAWTAMVTGYVQNARPREALDAFERMLKAGAKPDGKALVGAATACAMLGAPKRAHWLRAVAETSGLGPREDVFVGSAMVDMYAKCGSLNDAAAVFAAMRERNVVSYGSMIAALATHGRGGAAIRLFYGMVKAGTRPNGATFVGLLAACGHAGMVEQGRRIFAAMEERYGVVPSLEHYSCLVDLLGRAGQLEEALGVIQEMPMRPNGVVWGALLAACRTHRCPEIARVAACRVFELEPEEVGNYALLSSVYAWAGMWDEASAVRKLARERGVEKRPGLSWVEADPVGPKGTGRTRVPWATT